jgi:hypothetical protein
MRYLNRQTLNRRTANDNTVYVDANQQNFYVNVGASTFINSTNSVYMNTNTGSLFLPVGTTIQRAGTTPGMIRYNTDAVTNGQVEVYSAGRWRALRFAEQGPITQQNLGAGDGLNVYFGPLNSTYYNPSNNANNASIGGQNIIVVVENVMQLSGINYNVVQGTSGSPISLTETYNAFLSVAGSTGSSTLYFNTSLNVSGATWSSSGGGVVTLTLLNPNSTGAAFAPTGASIVVTGIASSGQPTYSYNGTFTVTGSTSTSVTYALVNNPGTYQNGGNATATGSYPAVFPAININGATVSGTGIYAGSTINSYTTDPDTDALTSITLSHAPTGSIPVNTNITIQESTQSTNNSYYLKFTTPVPYGKVVVALLGFDS